MTKDEWKKYIEAIHISKRYPGINGIGYAAYVLDEKKNSHDSMPVVYIEPVELNKAALTFDMGSESNRRKALEKSRDENKPYITSKIVLVQDANRTPGFLSYVPIYRNNANLNDSEIHKENFLGWVYAPFIAKDFFESLEERELKQIKDLIVLNVYSSHNLNKEQLLYSNKNTEGNLSFNFIRHINLYGQEWTFHIKPTAEFEKMLDSNNSILILILGLLVSFFIFYVIRSISITGAKAEVLAKQMTIELRKRTQDLERSNEELEQFAYVASHDLQEPLRTVASYASLLRVTLEKQNLLDEKNKEYFEYIGTAVIRMKALIADLLSFSRVGRNIKLEPVAIADIVSMSLGDLSVAIDEAHAQIEVAENLPRVLGDANKLRQLFQNLLSNALNYRDKEKAICKIKIHYEDYDKDYYKFTVEDNGIGIAKEYFEKVFVIFQRLEEVNCAGTGIGLALCKKIINYHGGQIWLESELGKYCRFCFTLAKLS